MARAQDTQIIIFGASGDLARRKLIPALVRLTASNDLNDTVSIVGVSRTHMSSEAFRKQLEEALPEDLHDSFRSLAPRIHYVAGDITERESMLGLRSVLDSLSLPRRSGRLFYLSLKPDLLAQALGILNEVRLLERKEGRWVRVVIEKPFGRDRHSAMALNRVLYQHLDENQIYRIDHYLGKETVQNLIGFRFHNTIFEPLWNRHHVESVQITVAETIGVERGRAGFYESNGAMRDVVQNHMLQLLALIAMEAPATLSAQDLRNQKVEVLRALHCPDPDDVTRHSVRARYTSGQIENRPVIGYLDEIGVAPDSTTETFVALRAEVDNWRWSGVPFLLRHGKRLKKRFTEIKVQFRTPPVQLFNRPDNLSDAEFRRKLRDGSLCQIRPNVLTIGIQPREELTLSFGVKRPGSAMVMTPAKLSFNYEDTFQHASPPAYQRLLLDALTGDPALFLRDDEIDASWRYIDEVIRGWNEDGAPELLEYPAGSWGPEQAEQLFEGCEGGWSHG